MQRAGLIYMFQAPLNRAACEALPGRPRPGWAAVLAATCRSRRPTWDGRSACRRGQPLSRTIGWL